MKIYRKRNHVGWVLVIGLWVLAFATMESSLGWVGFVLAGVVTLFKVLGTWSGDYDDEEEGFERLN